VWERGGMRGRMLIVLTVVLALIVGYASLSALRGGQSSNRGITTDVATLRTGHAVPLSVTLPGAHRTRARVFLVRPTGRPVTALLGISTHLGCRLLFRGDASFDEGFASPDAVAFEDPCGGSTYALDGRCIGGPCPRDLDRYPGGARGRCRDVRPPPPGARTPAGHRVGGHREVGARCADEFRGRAASSSAWTQPISPICTGRPSSTGPRSGPASTRG
jgi:hypothetical protein